ncbi:L-type lectin-domain containing receptor kinase S.4-like, partial [Trifolium medium]|nr:L-type lectin-domain containing receptor kinase S.4-like [Trifolium medium]
VSSQPDQLLYVGFKGLRSDNLTLTVIAEIKKSEIVLKLTNETSRLKDQVSFYSTNLNIQNSTDVKGTSIKPVMELTSTTRCAILLQQQSSTKQDFNLKSEKPVLA